MNAPETSGSPGERDDAEKKLRENETRLQVALGAADLGTFVWYVTEDRTEADARTLAHFGVPPDGSVTLAEALVATFHPEDGARYVAAIERAIDPAGPGTLHEEVRIRHPDGEERWVAVTAVTAFEGTPIAAVRMTGVLADVTVRKRAELALKASGERQAFLLKFSDTLRAIDNSARIQATASRLLAEYLGVNRALYMQVEGDIGKEEGLVQGQYVRIGAPLPDRMPLAGFGNVVTEELRAGRAFVAADVASDLRFDAAARHVYQSLDLAGYVAWPLVKEGRWIAVFGVHSAKPRDWTPLDVVLVSDVAERTWAAAERARVEAALRESEERFTQFAKASAAGIWIRDAETLAMEFVSPAVDAIYGMKSDELLGDLKCWAKLIVPDDRDVALGHIETARGGEATVHEFRIQRPSDGAFRWIRDTDFPLRDDSGAVRRIGGIADDVTEAKLAVEHQEVLLAELQHRARNIMAIIRSMASRTAESAESVDEYQSLLSGRLLALARVQVLLTRQANGDARLRDLIEEEVSVQAQHEGQYELTGPQVMLSPKATEVVTLAIHELATNALKYGALSAAGGCVRVTWETEERNGRPWLMLDWREEGAPPRAPPTRRGFGSELIEARIPYELSGTGKLSIEPGGAQCHLEFPLVEGESILETDAPASSTIFGGSLDMTGAPDLTGLSVLVIEDDYYLAADTASALRSAGAEIIGPCGNEQAAQRALEGQTPDAAVVDLNLGGGGPSFEVARMLPDRNVPFVFLTGYDAGVIPEDLAEVPRLQKPLELRKVVEAVDMLQPRP